MVYISEVNICYATGSSADGLWPMRRESERDTSSI